MMNQEDIFKKIGLILNELQDQYEYLAQNPQQLNELELELFMANASFLSDHVQIVRKLNNSKTVKALPEHANVQHEEVVTKHEEVVTKPVEVKVPLNEEVVAQKSINQEREQPENAEIETVKDTQKAEIQPVAQEEDHHNSPLFEEEVFKFDREPSTFEFILKDVSTSDKFEFEEKSIDDIFDRPLSKEEELIIAQKQKLRAQQEEPLKETDDEKENDDDDEIGPEPFLVLKAEDVIPPAVTQLVPDEPEEKEMPLEEETPVVVTKLSEIVANKTEDVAKMTLNELLASQMGNKQIINSETARGAITDLKQGINLNDKMLYIKDLFNGYNLAYAEAIDLLNKMPDFKTADAFLQNNYAAKNNWTSKQETVDQFYELLNLRFPANG